MVSGCTVRTPRDTRRNPDLPAVVDCCRSATSCGRRHRTWTNICPTVSKHSNRVLWRRAVRLKRITPKGKNRYYNCPSNGYTVVTIVTEIVFWNRTRTGGIRMAVHFIRVSSYAHATTERRRWISTSSLSDFHGRTAALRAGRPVRPTGPLSVHSAISHLRRKNK
jgi:hypothetical protein